MNPLRIVIIAVLVYIGYRLLTSGKKSSGAQRGEQPDDAAEPRVSDVLMEDPVCHKLVPKHQAVRLRHQGETVYFCSDACCEEFIRDHGEQ